MKVKNRSASVVGYSVPDLHVRRRFLPNEVKDIDVEELRQLLYQSGGRELLTNYLQVAKEDVEKLDMGEQEKEYYFSNEEIIALIKTGSIEEFLDMLDFAPDGVINLVKEYAISLPMTDLQKIKALREKTGFDATKIMENTDTEGAAAAPETTHRRRAESSTSKYKIISDN